jgi:hypothetical protein
MICLLKVIEQIGTKNIPTTGLGQRVTLGGAQKAQGNGPGVIYGISLSDSSV